ncbi:MAG TPA: hypothetical protein VF208_08735, partial [Candidatus Binatia bacterium]
HTPWGGGLGIARRQDSPRPRKFSSIVVRRARSSLRVLEILKSEIVATQGSRGITRLDQLARTYPDKVQPLAPAHEMSAFPHMPGGRLP